MPEARPPFAAALGKISSGLYIATARVEGAPLGMLCSFVEQASFEPPMITLAIAPGRPICAALDGAGTFGLHVLGKGDTALMKSFARGGTAESFAGHQLVENADGVPQLAGAWAFLVGQVRERMAAGDHTVYLAEIIDGVLQREGEEPMTRVRPHGFTY